MRRRINILVVLAGMLIPSLSTLGQTLNYKMESLYVYNFTKYIDWPANDNSTEFVIGVYGNSPLTEELNRSVAGKHVGFRTISVKVFKTLDEAMKCQILFIPTSESGNLKKMTDELKGKPILVVCEKEGLCRKGAGISIFLDDDDDYKTKFEMNKNSIENNGLVVSKMLLRLATQSN
jgi:hypothetical protein